MRRRGFIKLLSAAAAWPLGARGQGAKRVAVLIPLAESDTEAQREIAAFRETSPT